MSSRSPYGMIKYFTRSKILYPASSASRYRVLLDIIFQNKCKSIMEIGVYTGRRAIEMIETAKIHHDVNDITYYGFDLFEEMNEEILKKQLSKKPDSLSIIKDKLDKTGAGIILFKGWSENTLSEFVAQKEKYVLPDLVFIDGGHAVETIAADWGNVAKLVTHRTIVVFDDYYIDCPHLTDKFGCNKTVDSLDRDIFSIEVLKTKDTFHNEDGVLNVSMAKITRRK